VLYKDYQLSGDKLSIVTYPDPVLSAVAKPVTEFDSHLEQLVKDMLFTMYHAPGIGLAAPQVGKSIRMFVLDVEYDREVITNAAGSNEIRMSNFAPKVFINPVITGLGGSTAIEEGCLSVPGVYEEIKRFERVHVRYQDVKGKTHELEADDLYAICLQHENDHLDGVVFIERLSNLKKNFYKKKMQKEKAQR
jgi:peptide deformylase